jgi:hypothetical protein
VNLFAGRRFSAEKGHHAGPSARFREGRRVSGAVVIGEGDEIDSTLCGGTGDRDRAGGKIAAGAQAGVVVEIRPDRHGWAVRR